MLSHHDGAVSKRFDYLLKPSLFGGFCLFVCLLRAVLCNLQKYTIQSAPKCHTNDRHYPDCVIPITEVGKMEAFPLDRGVFYCNVLAPLLPTPTVVKIKYSRLRSYWLIPVPGMKRCEVRF